MTKGLVGPAGFEPATSWSQTRRPARLGYGPLFVSLWSARRESDPQPTVIYRLQGL